MEEGKATRENCNPRDNPPANANAARSYVGGDAPSLTEPQELRAQPIDMPPQLAMLECGLFREPIARASPAPSFFSITPASIRVVMYCRAVSGEHFAISDEQRPPAPQKKRQKWFSQRPINRNASCRGRKNRYPSAVRCAGSSIITKTFFPPHSGTAVPVLSSIEMYEPSRSCSPSVFRSVRSDERKSMDAPSPCP